MAAGRTDILSGVGNLWHASVCLPNQRVTAHVTSTAICDVGYRVDTSLFYKDADKSLGKKQATTTEDFDFHISYL